MPKNFFVKVFLGDYLFLTPLPLLHNDEGEGVNRGDKGDGVSKEGEEGGEGKEEKISRWRDNLQKRKDSATQPMDHGRLR